MTQWKPDINHRKGPRYLAIAEAIGEAVRTGALLENEQLPTHRDLAYQLGVTVGTVSRAYAEAVRRDYVVGEVGRGTYVRPSGAERGTFPIPYQVDPTLIDFSLNFPAEGARVELLREGLMAVAQDEGLGALLRYQSEQGMPHHRQSFAKWAGYHGAPEDPERVVMTCGVQHGMALALMVLTHSGDGVMSDTYCYAGIKALASQNGLKLHGLERDDDGILPESLERTAQQTGAKILYCMPNYQNPSSITMPKARREALADVARRLGIWIIEDDIYGFLHDNPSDHVPFAQLLPQQTFYLNGASKCIGPGIRVGFMVVPQDKVKVTSSCVRLSSWMVAPLNVELLHRWIEDGTVFDQMIWHRHEAEARRQIVIEQIGQHPFMAAPRTYHGWLTLPDHWEAERFCLRAREQNVAVIPASVFQVGRGASENAVRLCYGAPNSQAQVKQGAEILGVLLEEDVNFYRAVM